LESGAIVECPHHYLVSYQQMQIQVRGTRTWLKFARKHCILNLIRELKHAVHFRLTFFTLFDECRKFFIHHVFSTKKLIHFFFLDREACLDRLLPSPVLAMSLTLDEDLGDIGISVPAETNCLCTFCLLEATQIELKIFIVKINGSNGRIFRLELFVGIKYCDSNDPVRAFSL
jgi:hypothetical protein